MQTLLRVMIINKMRMKTFKVWQKLSTVPQVMKTQTLQLANKTLQKLTMMVIMLPPEHISNMLLHILMMKTNED